MAKEAISQGVKAINRKVSARNSKPKYKFALKSKTKKNEKKTIRRIVRRIKKRKIKNSKSLASVT